jgi:hypothetical protein
MSGRGRFHSPSRDITPIQPFAAQSELLAQEAERATSAVTHL